MPLLTTWVRWRIVYLKIDSGSSIREIAAYFHASIEAVRGNLRVYELIDFIDLPLSGRPRVTEENDDFWLTNTGRVLSSVPLTFNNGSARNVESTSRYPQFPGECEQMDTLVFDLSSVRPWHRNTRFDWAQHHRHWSVQRQRRQVVFSDESRSSVYHYVDGRMRVRRASHARYSNINSATPTVLFGGDSVKIWGAISWNHWESKALTAARYRREILEDVAIPFVIASVGESFVFQDDNAHPHGAAVVEEFHKKHMDYLHFSRPSCCPELNPTEHTWDMLGRARKTKKSTELGRTNYFSRVGKFSPAPNSKTFQVDEESLWSCRSNSLNGGPRRYWLLND